MVDTQQFLDIVRQAAQCMLTDFSITQKEGYANIVTTSDVAVQEFLIQHLGQLLPGSGFLCEEADMNDLQHDYTWIIDPIDGTANYSRGIDQCAICVGLHHIDRIVQSAVFIPRTGEMFHAVLGQGAWRNGQPIHVSDRPWANSVLCTALPVYHKEYAEVCSRIITEAFGQINDLRRFGAAAPELCYLAMGRCELYFEYLLSPWDYAAASLILTEAGGCLSALDGQPVPMKRGSGVLAANSPDSLHRLQALVRKHTET